MTATRLLEGDSSYIYRFSVTHDGSALIEGRASIFIRAASFMKRRALVTGGSGTIGAVICQRLAAMAAQSSCTPTGIRSPPSRWWKNHC